MDLNKTSNFFGVVLVVGIFLVLVFASLSNDAPDGLSNLLSALIGASIAVGYGIYERRRIEKRRREAILSGLDIELISIIRLVNEDANETVPAMALTLFFQHIDLFDTPLIQVVQFYQKEVVAKLSVPPPSPMLNGRPYRDAKLEIIKYLRELIAARGAISNSKEMKELLERTKDILKKIATS